MAFNRIYAHRGYWCIDGTQKHEKNSLTAIQNAIEAGYGAEIDLRDSRNEVIVSHDPANEDTLSLKKILNLKGHFALDVKSEGLIDLLPNLDGLASYFFFDMSVPEQVKYKIAKLINYSRLSEYENEIMNFETSGYWVDGFNGDWWTDLEFLKYAANSSKKYVFVSPELHGRDPNGAWSVLVEYFKLNPNFYICTDYPDSFSRLL